MLFPAFAFEVARDFARKVFAFEDIDSRLVQKQCVDFGVACAGGNIEIPHQNILALVGVADAGGECHHRGFAKDAARVVCDALVVEFRVGLEEVFAASGGVRDSVAAEFKGLVESTNSVVEALFAFLFEVVEGLSTAVAVEHLPVPFRSLALDLEKDKGEYQDDADEGRKSHASF